MSQASQPGLTRVPSRERIQQRLLRPHILTEIVKTGLALSGRAHPDFIAVLVTVSTSFDFKAGSRAAAPQPLQVFRRDRIAGRAGKKGSFELQTCGCCVLWDLTCYRNGFAFA